MTANRLAVTDEAPPVQSTFHNSRTDTETPTDALDGRPAPSGWVAACAMAAGLTLGVLLAGSFGIGSNISTAGGVLWAGGNLAQRLGGELSGHGLGPSFWSREGAFCRAFAIGAGTAPGLSGIACRESAGWRISVITEGSDPSRLPVSVAAVMNNLIVGVPLDAGQEAQARRQAWRSR